MITGSSTVTATSGEWTAMIAMPIRYTPCRSHRSTRLPQKILGNSDPSVYAATITLPTARTGPQLRDEQRQGRGQPDRRHVHEDDADQQQQELRRPQAIPGGCHRGVGTNGHAAHR